MALLVGFHHSHEEMASVPGYQLWPDPNTVSLACREWTCNLCAFFPSFLLPLKFKNRDNLHKNLQYNLFTNLQKHSIVTLTGILIVCLKWKLLTNYFSNIFVKLLFYLMTNNIMTNESKDRESKICHNSIDNVWKSFHNRFS